MEEIRIFNNPDFGDVRTVMIDDEPWFVGKDVCTVLKYARPDNAVVDRVDEEDRRYIDSKTHPQNKDVIDYRELGQRGGWLINESGLYSLIFGSKLESAKKFKRWVTAEVLPSLRKTGGYRVPQTIPEQIQLLAQGNVELNQRVDTLTERMDKIELDLPILPVEADLITEAVRRKGVSSMGGKQSSAYRDRSLRQRVYNNLYGHLKYQFGIKSYKAIKRSQCDRAVQIINEWKPPVFLADEIDACNSQMQFSI